MRLFIGIVLPDEVKEAILSLQKAEYRLHWQHWDQLHLTLCFLGEVHDSITKELQHHLNQLPFFPFDLSLHGCGTFGSGHAPNSLWVGIRPDSSLDKLQKSCTRLARQCGIKTEKRDYKPHITICRPGKKGVPKDLGKFLVDFSLYEGPVFKVENFALYRSDATPNGSMYSIVESYGDWDEKDLTLDSELDYDPSIA